jgi:hypothetical protein
MEFLGRVLLQRALLAFMLQTIYNIYVHGSHPWFSTMPSDSIQQLRVSTFISASLFLRLPIWPSAVTGVSLVIRLIRLVLVLPESLSCLGFVCILILYPSPTYHTALILSRFVFVPAISR